MKRARMQTDNRLSQFMALGIEGLAAPHPKVVVFKA